VELKFAVGGEAAFEALERAAGTKAHEAVNQTNHFFDTADLRLNAAKYTIRLRDEAGHFTLAAKGPESRRETTGMTMKREEELTLDDSTARKLRDGVLSPLALLQEIKGDEARELVEAIRKRMGTSQLTYIGCFENQRARLPVTLAIGARDVTLPFELDRVTLPGDRVNYEVEVELKGDDQDLAARVVTEFLKEAGVEWQTAPSKAKRFFGIEAVAKASERRRRSST
jgi:uncharacterized protein YjbK